MNPSSSKIMPDQMRWSSVTSDGLLRQEPCVSKQNSFQKRVENAKQQTPAWFISPESPRLIKWEIFIMVLVLYNTFVTPLRITFSVGTESDSPLTWLEIIVDFIFLTDVMVRFRVGVRSATVKDLIIYDWRVIAKSYLSGYFLIDVLASIPLDLITVAPQLGIAKVLKTIRLLKLAKLVKLLRLIRLKSIMDNIQERFIRGKIPPGVIKMVNTIFWVLIFTHLLSCLWYFVSDYIDDGSTDNWLRTHEAEAYVEQDTGALYLASLYWTVSTLTSVGYGDIVAQNEYEQVVAIIVSWMGASVFGFIIGHMNSIVLNMNKASSEFHSKMDSIDAYLKYRKVPQQLQLDIRRHFRYYISRKTLFDEEQILADLSHYLRAELSFFLTSDVIRQVHLFKDIKDTSFLTEIVTMLKPLSAVPAQVIMEQGDIALEMYLILRGSVEVYSDTVPKVTMSDGSHFGVCGIDEGVNERRRHTAVAITHCDLFALSKNDLCRAAETFPEVRAQMERAQEMVKTVERNVKSRRKIRRLTMDDANFTDLDELQSSNRVASLESSSSKPGNAPENATIVSPTERRRSSPQKPVVGSPKTPDDTVLPSTENANLLEAALVALQEQEDKIQKLHKLMKERGLLEPKQE